MKDKLAKGVAWLGASKVIVNLLALSSTIILARLLTPEDFGLVALVMAILAIIESVTDLSLASALIHHKDPTPEHYDTAWTLNLTRATVIALAFSLSAPFVANFYHDERLLNIMFVMALSIFVSGFSSPKIVVLTRNLVFWQEFAMAVAQKIAGFSIGVIVAIVYKSYWALVWGTVAGKLVGILVTYAIAPYKPKFTYQYVREIWSFSIWLTLGKIVNTLNWKFDHLIVGSHLGQNALGYYSVGENLAGMPTREAISPLESTLFPGFSQITHDIPRLRNAYISAQSLISALALPLGVGFALVSHPLILLLMGEKWLPVVQIIQVISCVYVLQTLGSQVHPLAMALGQTKLLFNRDLISLVVRLPIIIAGLYLGGLVGLIYARAITGTLALAINMYLIRRLIDLPIIHQLKANVRSMTSVLIMAFAVLSVQNQITPGSTPFELAWHVALFVLIGASVYLVTHVSLWLIMKKPKGPETEMMRMLTGFINKVKKKLKLRAIG